MFRGRTQQRLGFNLPDRDTLSPDSVKLIGNGVEVARLLHPENAFWRRFEKGGWIETANFYSWIPDFTQPSPALRQEKGLLAWMREIVRHSLPASVALVEATEKEVREAEMQAAIDVYGFEPFAVDLKGVHFVNLTGSHDRWREALRTALFTEAAKKGHVGLDGPDARTFELFHRLAMEVRALHEQEFARKLMRKNRRKTNDQGDYDDKSAVLQKFAERVPGTNVMLWHGARFTHLAETVFTRLYAKLSILVAEVERTDSALRRQWVSENALGVFLDKFRKGQIFLIEMDSRGLPEQLGTTKADAFVDSERFVFASMAGAQDNVGITIKFRRNLARVESVLSEAKLFHTLVHEMSHLVHLNLFALMKGYPARWAELSSWADKAQQEELVKYLHPRDFWVAYTFLLNVAARAGLVADHPENWRRNTRSDRLQSVASFRGIPYVSAESLEQQLTREGAIKRTREDDDWSHFSDDADNSVDARYLALFARYLGRPVDKATVLRAADHWRAQGQLGHFAAEVCATRVCGC